MKNFTIFQPGFDCDTFNKDVGIIPIIFKKHLWYNCSFLCNYINGSYEVLKEAGVNVVFIKNDDTIADCLKNTDILMLYGIYNYNIEMISKYKEIKPEGKIYLKLDMNIHWVKNIDMNKELTDSLNKCTLISVECRTLERYIKENWKVPVQYIPNGYYNFKESFVNYEDKEDTIITVGRLGTYQKATEVLLEAFKSIAPSIKNYKLKLIGGVEESFKQYIDDFLKQNPELSQRIIFTGKITDRNKLEEEYEKAKIFCIPSRYEGFPNVFPESAYKGCYIISSNIDPAYDITDKKKYGSIFEIDNTQELSRQLIFACSNDSFLRQVSMDIQKFARENFDWIKLCKKIEYFLNIPNEFYDLMPYLISRITMEDFSKVLDMSKYPVAKMLLSQECCKPDIIIDRIETDNSLYYKDDYNKVYYGNVNEIIDIMPKYDVILLAGILEYYTKEDGAKLIDKLLLHTKKLILAVPKVYKDKYISRWSYIDFYKYNMSCINVFKNNKEYLIFSIYEGNKEINNLDLKFKNFKETKTLNNRNKLNIAYILPHKSITGGLKILIKQMKYLKEKGHRITGILKGKYSGSIFPDSDKIEIDNEIIVKENEKTEDYLKGYDVIVTGFINDLLEIQNEKLPVLLFEQGYETIFGQYRNTNCNAEKNSKLYFDNVYNTRQSLIMTVSPFLSDILYYRYGRIADIIPNGIDKNVYYPINNKKNSCVKVLLIGSSYLDFKGFDIAINVLKRLKELLINIKVTWICQEKPYFEVPLDINYVVNPDEKTLTKTIRENDILLSASWYESFALPPLEAMASGACVIATDNGGIRAYAENGYNCLLTEPSDENGLLSIMLSLILNDEKRNTLTQNGLKTAEKFSMENMINTLEEKLYAASSFYKEYFEEGDDKA